MKKDRGFTLVEMNLAVIIVGVLAAVLVSFYALAPKAYARTRAKNRARALAIGLIEEIKCRKWDEKAPTKLKSAIGHDAGEDPADKRTFDDIDDFNAYSEIRPLYQDGTLVPGVAGFSLSVDTVCYVDDALNFSAATTTRKKITLTVRKEGVAQITLSTVLSQK